jgi:hypothetical protein
MNKITASPEKNTQLLTVRVDELRHALQQINPKQVASHAGAHYSDDSDNGMFEFEFLGARTLLSYPEYAAYDNFTGSELPVAVQALILYYFYNADGSALTDRWIAFSELQDGRFYTQAFQGYSGDKLGKLFADDLDTFRKAALAIGGIPHSMANASFVFQLLPRVPLLALAWQGDDEFPSSYQILFNESVNHYLPTDACAIAGSMLTRKLIRASDMLS